jgi:UDP-glucuronate 4-epimerase
LGNSNPITLKDLVSLMEKNLEVKPEIQWLPSQLGDVERTYADISKSKAMLGYEPKVSIEAGIKMFSDWIKASRKS